MAPSDGAVPALGFAASQPKVPFAEQLLANATHPCVKTAAAGWSPASGFEQCFEPSH